MTSLVEAHHSDKWKIDCVLTVDEVERATRRTANLIPQGPLEVRFKKLNSGPISRLAA
jgi:hypothetical protein